MRISEGVKYKSGTDKCANNYIPQSREIISNAQLRWQKHTHKLLLLLMIF